MKQVCIKACHNQKDRLGTHNPASMNNAPKPFLNKFIRNRSVAKILQTMALTTSMTSTRTMTSMQVMINRYLRELALTRLSRGTGARMLWIRGYHRKLNHRISSKPSKVNRLNFMRKLLWYILNRCAATSNRSWMNLKSRWKIKAMSWTNRYPT